MRHTNGQDKVYSAFFERKPANGPKCYNRRLDVFGERIIHAYPVLSQKGKQS